MRCRGGEVRVGGWTCLRVLRRRAIDVGLGCSRVRISVYQLEDRRGSSRFEHCV